MFSPKDHQIEICLLKNNLEEIESNLTAQRALVPSLDAERDAKYRETMAALRAVRSNNEEIERLKLEEIKLTAKRVQLKTQREDIINALEEAQKDRFDLEVSLKKEEHKMDLEIRKYEDTLGELASCFRRMPAYYNEEEIKNEMEVVKEMILELQKEQQRRQTDVSDLKCKLSNLVNNVPENILSIVGKEELDEKLQSLSNRCETLRSQYSKYLLGNQAGATSTTSRKYEPIN